MNHATRPIKRPGLRAALLNAALRRYVKSPAERAESRGIEVNDRLLARGARRTAQMMQRNERVPSFVKVEAVTIPTPAGVSVPTPTLSRAFLSSSIGISCESRKNATTSSRGVSMNSNRVSSFNAEAIFCSAEPLRANSTEAYFLRRKVRSAHT